MKLTVVCVGKLKEKYLCQAQDEYVKRLSRFAKTEIVEVAEERDCGDGERVLTAEGKRILAATQGADVKVALCIEGERMDSVAFCDYIERKKTAGASSICFIIGGSTGLSREVKAAADLRLSFSDMTMAHQLFRIVLLEQLYRACKIASGEVYHK